MSHLYSQVNWVSHSERLSCCMAFRSDRSSCSSFRASFPRQNVARPLDASLPANTPYGPSVTQTSPPGSTRWGQGSATTAAANGNKRTMLKTADSCACCFICDFHFRGLMMSQASVYGVKFTYTIHVHNVKQCWTLTLTACSSIAKTLNPQAKIFKFLK